MSVAACWPPFFKPLVSILKIGSEVEQEMRTSEMKKRKPVLGFLAPTGANGSALAQPAEGAFHHPASGWILGLTRHRAGIFRFISSSAVFDMRDIAQLFDLNMHLPTVIAFVETQVLRMGRTVDQDGTNQGAICHFSL